MQRRRFALAALLVVGMAFSSQAVFADGGTDQPTPKPNGGGLVSEAVCTANFLFDAASLMLELVY